MKNIRKDSNFIIVIALTLLSLAFAVMAPFVRYITLYSNIVLVISRSSSILLLIAGIFGITKYNRPSWAVFFFPLIFSILIEEARWPFLSLERLGFQVSLMYNINDLRSCKMITFVDGGQTQSVGLCQIGRWLWEVGSHYIVIDTSHELDIPQKYRTAEWKKAISNIVNGNVIANKNLYTIHVYSNFYDVLISNWNVD